MSNSLIVAWVVFSVLLIGLVWLCRFLFTERKHLEHLTLLVLDQIFQVTSRYEITWEAVRNSETQRMVSTACNELTCRCLWSLESPRIRFLTSIIEGSIIQGTEQEKNAIKQILPGADVVTMTFRFVEAKNIRACDAKKAVLVYEIGIQCGDGETHSYGGEIGADSPTGNRACMLYEQILEQLGKRIATRPNMRVV